MTNDSERSVPCPQCGGVSRPAFRTADLNRRVDRRLFRYLQCRVCGVVFLLDVPPDLGRYYPPDYYRVPNSLSELEELGRPEAYKLQLIQRFRSEGRLVEVGSGNGAFAYLARRAGFDVTAIEMDERCCRYLAAETDLQIINSADECAALRAAPEADVLALWQVVEHLSDPWSALQTAASRLRPGGILILATPNPGCLQFRLFRGKWLHVDAPRHLWLIPPPVLVKRAADWGLSLRLQTSRDLGSLFCDAAGWASSLVHVFGLPPKLGWITERTLRAAGPIIQARDGQGSSVTLVFEKRSPEPA